MEEKSLIEQEIEYLQSEEFAKVVVKYLLDHKDEIAILYQEFEKYFNQNILPILAQIGKYYEIHIKPKIEKTVEYINENSSEITYFIKFHQGISKMGGSQFVFWEQPNEEFLDSLLASADADKFLLTYSTNNNVHLLNKAIESSKVHGLLSLRRKEFAEIVFCYENKSYYSTIKSQFALFDYILSKITNLKTATRIMSHFDKIMETYDEKRSLSSAEYSERALVLTTVSTVSNIAENIKFDQEEPKLLNRHWIMHGRSTREISQLDCIKMFNLIYGILLLSDMVESEEEDEI